MMVITHWPISTGLPAEAGAAKTPRPANSATSTAAKARVAILISRNLASGRAARVGHHVMECGDEPVWSDIEAASQLGKLGPH